MRDWRNSKRKRIPFAIPIIWREGKDHITDCYFCRINLKGINRKNKHHVQYPDDPSAIRPIPHDPDLPVPEPEGNMEYSSDTEHWDMTVVAGMDDRRGRRTSTLDPSRTQRPDTRPERFKGVFSAAGFTSQREICWHQKQCSTGVKNMREN